METLKNLGTVLPLCDLVAIYDNTTAFRRFAIYKKGECVRQSSNIPDWYKNSILENEKIMHL